ncbi:MAG: MFS transporter [Steroidobacteraceae bacterium]
MHDSTLTGTPTLTTASKSYQWLLIALLSFNFGIVFFDRNALNFLTPFIQPELKLTNTQIGMFASALSLSWALAGLFIGWLSDKMGRRKILLVIATLVFSVASVLSGVAGTFLSLLGARLLMGLAEGGIMPISQTLIATEVAHERRGLAQGLTQNFGANLIGNFLGPIVIVWIGATYGWREAFYVCAVPGFISAVLIAFLVREPARAAPASVRAKVPLLPLLTDRTMLLCILISTLLVAFFVVFMGFTPLYLTQVRGVDSQNMGLVMSSFGLASIAVAFIVPGSSDRFGRKPVAIIASLVGLILPLGVLASSGTSVTPIVLSFVFGCCISGVFPLVMATIPSESVSPVQTATALSLTMGISEIVGGVIAPTAAGKLADLYGLPVVLWILAGICLACGLLAMLLPETAPRVLAKRAAAR